MFTDLCSSFSSFVFKIKLIKILLFRAYEICSTFQNLHNEITFIKEMLLKIGYNINIIDNTINKILWKIFYSNKDIYYLKYDEVGL